MSSTNQSDQKQKKEYEKIKRSADANMREYYKNNPDAAKKANRSVLFVFAAMGIFVVLLVIVGLAMKR